MKDTLYVLDGYGLIYRAYFAFIHRPLTDREGKNVSAISGFFRTLFALRRTYDAKSILVAFDPIGPTFRHEEYPEYKSTRDSAPEDLHAQVQLIEKLLALMGIPMIRIDRYEADDVMGSVAQLCRRQGRVCQLVSADKDLMQLVDDEVHLLRPEKGGGFRDMGPKEVFEEKGVRPDQMIDYLALIGDTSDNIPGVAGIGEKTAAALLAQWDNLDDLYANLESAAKGAKLEKLIAGQEAAYFSRNLVSIVCDLPIEKELIQDVAVNTDFAAAARIFLERDLRTLAGELEGLQGISADSPLASTAPAMPLAVGDSASLETRYTAILNETDLDIWSKKIQAAGIFALDTETDNIDPMRANLVGLSVSVKAGEAAYLPIRIVDGPSVDQAVVVNWLNDIFRNSDIRIVGQNFKYDMKVLHRAGIALREAWFDTMIAAWVLDASSPVGMDSLADRYLGLRTLKFNDIVPKGGSFDQVSLEDAVRYAAEDADITLRLYHVFAPMLEQDTERLAIFRDMEMPLQPILAAMEFEGIGLDIGELEAYGRELEGTIDGLVKEIHQLCGHEFNIASPKQLQTVLFEERGLSPGKKTKSGYSTDISVLTELASEDPVPEKILHYRSLTKLKSTYVDVLPQLINPSDGRIHTSYSQTGAATGRLSSNNPNLQNIPVRDDNGRRIRNAFKSRAGCLFVSADYSQIELVVLAHMSGDKALSLAFQEGVDVHSRTAALLFGIDSQDVTSEQRRMAKTVNFGVMYGMSAFRLSNELGISRKEAKHFIDAYFITYMGIKNFVDEAVALAEKEGGVRTLRGRFRPLPGINSRNRVEKAAAERAAVNSRIQGTAADIMKKAMLEVNQVLSQQFPQSHMLLQVHDELLIETPESEVEAASKLLRDTMEASANLSVPLKVSVEIGRSWGELH